MNNFLFPTTFGTYSFDYHYSIVPIRRVNGSGQNTRLILQLTLSKHRFILHMTNAGQKMDVSGNNFYLFKITSYCLIHKI